MHLLAHEPIPVELEDADDRNRDAATAGWNARPFAVMRAGDDPFYEGLRHREIAALMNIPCGTVISRLHRGRRRLRRLPGNANDSPPRTSA
jgi:hypothetical protein